MSLLHLQEAGDGKATSEEHTWNILGSDFQRNLQVLRGEIFQEVGRECIVCEPCSHLWAEGWIEGGREEGERRGGGGGGEGTVS